jgi:hypothetical protein
MTQCNYWNVVVESLLVPWMNYDPIYLNLQQKCPQLAKDFIRLRGQLDSPAASMVGVNQRHRASQELEQTVEAIRKLPGFVRFLLAQSENELKAAAACGPIANINVSDY